MFIKNNIIAFEKFSININNKTVFVTSCKVTIEDTK